MHRSRADIATVESQQVSHICNEAGSVMPCELEDGGLHSLAVIRVICSQITGRVEPCLSEGEL